MRLEMPLAAAALLAVMTEPAFAVWLSLSSAHEVSALLIGDTGRIDVRLCELGGGDELIVLEAGALCDGAAVQLSRSPTTVAGPGSSGASRLKGDG